ncbi:MAG: DUF402 domain-containing protein [Clostridiales bacterium]|jgi:predicted RNA-binding protein associated with RNAse of E/G family|nr:DUF402 domain-containing protein [Clostridiales bacterium]
MNRRKYIGFPHRCIKSYSSKVSRLDEDGIKGYASFMMIESVNEPLYVGNNNNIVEWYVDINKENGVDEEGNPYGDDLYLDAVLLPGGDVLVLDADELKTALENDSITQNNFNMAYDTLNMLRETQILTVTYMKDLCHRLKRLIKD